MIDGARIEGRLKEQRLTKSELARRVGVTPPAIRKIVHGESYNSRYLHLIARELGTTPAYLTGETDDPDSDVPDAPELSRQERELIDCFATLSPESRAALIHVAHTMADKGKPTVHSPRTPFRAQVAT